MEGNDDREVPGDCRTSGLKISVGAADKADVWMLPREPKIDFDFEEIEGGMKMVAVGVGGNEMGFCLLRGGG